MADPRVSSIMGNMTFEMNDKIDRRVKKFITNSEIIGRRIARRLNGGRMESRSHPLISFGNERPHKVPPRALQTIKMMIPKGT